MRKKFELTLGNPRHLAQYCTHEGFDFHKIKQFFFDVENPKLLLFSFFEQKKLTNHCRKPKGHEDYLLCGGTLYLKVEGFSPTDLVEWIKVFLQIEGYPVDSLEKATYNEFADENPMMRMLGNKTY